MRRDRHRKKIRPTKTKEEIRLELERQVNSYISHGGEVKSIPNGVSGNEQNVSLFSQSTQFEPKKERTPVTDVVKDLEARKKIKPETIRATKRGPKKKLITDDFGEPLRWVWEE